MKAPTLKSRSGRKGSALLIILAFVLLLTIITTAFLSKAMLERTVSSASSGQTRADLLATGAIDAILSDCQQEIAAGSSLSKQTVGGRQVTIFNPSTAQTIVPSRTWQSAAIVQPNPLPNLLKRSACGLTFYPTGTMSGAGSYSASSYPPVQNTFAAADANVSTSATSLNGRSYSAARWNQALLLPKATMTGIDTTPVAQFTVPDWILVQRDGANPTAWAASLRAVAANANPVVGRYAYTIYDEGGVLDMNVAGFHSSSALPNATSNTQWFYRTSLASVDLTKLLPMTVSGTTVTQGTAFFPNSNSGLPTQVILPKNDTLDKLIGWRNFATLQVSSGTIQTGYSVPTPSAVNTLATNYFQNVQTPGSGFLRATIPSTVPALSSGQSDRKFSSRQQLIDLLVNDIGSGSVANQANFQNALQYMGTFSRDLNQPSFQPDTGRPRIQGSTVTLTTAASTTVTDLAYNGGNAAATDDAADQINVAFPSTLVQTSFIRNDGSPAYVGDPLVKKRFALNRLAWLTFNGPIANDSGTLNPNSNSGVAALITQLKTNYGYTDAFLKQGGPTNIKKYFGLQWQQDPNDDNATLRSKWFYNVHNNSAGSTGLGIIRELGGSSGIAAASDADPHDPDFFELLKATILAGSKGKTLTTLSGWKNFQSKLDTALNLNHPVNAQNNIDVSFDYQILQIGANIIDQSRLDAYTTEIIFDNGTGPFTVRGVENFPYLYRLRTGSLKLRNETGSVPDQPIKTGAADPGPPAVAATTPANQTNYPLAKDTGVAALMQIPEIWNPHDVNSPMGIALGTATLPTSFRIVVDSTTPANLATQKTTTPPPPYSYINVYGYDVLANSPINNVHSNYASTASKGALTYNLGPPTAPIGTVSGGNGGYDGEALKLDPTNTALTFTVPTTTSTLYREPTMLARPNVPAGSNLAVAWSSSPPTDWTKVANSAGTTCYTSGQGFISEINNPLSLATAPASSQKYLGIVLGLYPVQWIIPQSSTPVAATNYFYISGLAALNSSISDYGLTYRMQYLDPVQGGWVTYDQKYIQPNSDWVYTPLAGSSSGNLVQKGTSSYQAGAWQSFADPRTSRFGAIGGDSNTAVTYLSAPGTFPFKASPDWLDPRQWRSRNRPSG